MSPSELPFESLDRFLGLPTEQPSPWVLVDLGWLWVPGEGVPVHLRDEIEQSVLRAFGLCTMPDEWIYGWHEPNDSYWGGLYRFWPHRAEVESWWEVWLWPDGDDQIFVSQSFDWGIYAYWSHPGLDGWALSVFGKPLLDAFSGHWPAAGHRSFAPATARLG